MEARVNYYGVRFEDDHVDYVWDNSSARYKRYYPDKWDILDREGEGLPLHGLNAHFHFVVIVYAIIICILSK